MAFPTGSVAVPAKKFIERISNSSDMSGVLGKTILSRLGHIRVWAELTLNPKCCGFRV